VFASSYLASVHCKNGGVELGSLLVVGRALARRNLSSAARASDRCPIQSQCSGSTIEGPTGRAHVARPLSNYGSLDLYTNM
jgi:hypothetical protein